MKKPKLRIFDTIGYGFYFALSHYGSLLKLTWLPALVAIVIFDIQTSVQILARRGDLPSVGFVPEYTALFVWLPIYLLLAIPAVAGYRMAVFGRKAPPGVAYFKLGGTELQFLAAQLVVSVYMIIYLILALAVIVPASLGLHQLMTMGAAAAQASGYTEVAGIKMGDAITLWLRVGAVATLAIAVAYLFGVVLFSLVQPIVVAERRVGIWRSLSLLWFTNAVRLSVVWFVAGITLLSATAVLFQLASAYVPVLIVWMFPAYSPTNTLHAILMFNAVVIVPSILIGTLVLGVTAGVNGFAYRQIALGGSKGTPA